MKVSCNVLYSSFSTTLLYFYHHNGSRIPISLCSIKITEASEQNDMVELTFTKKVMMKIAQATLD